ncbi:MAG: diguanylate cyclase [Anaerolineales bacterium]|nr:diguanylate cyclase [Anaerolineales bacterium]
MTKRKKKADIGRDDAVFADLGRELAATADAREAARIILDAANALVGWDAAYLILYDPEQPNKLLRSLYLADTIKGERSELKEFSFDAPSANMLKAIAEGGFVSSFDDERQIPENAPSIGGGDKRTLSQMFVPVVSGSRTIGVMSVQSYHKNFYNREQLILMNDLASHCAGALERVWAQEALSGFVERLKALHAAITEINANLETESICRALYEAVIKVMPCDDFVIDGYDKRRNEIIPIYAIEYPSTRLFLNRYVADHGLSGAVVKTQKSFLMNSRADMRRSGIQFEWHSTHQEEPTYSILAAPMILNGEAYGMVSAQSYKENAYSDEDLYLLEALASHAVIAIENARLFDSIQQIADADPLTGILNRRRFYALAERHFERTRSHNIPLSMIMLDIDDFKMFNDRFGHQTGDAVLLLVTETCKAALRADDVFGRLGGEEFAVALPATKLDDALEIASRLREAIAKAKLPQSDIPAITVSVGVADCNQNCKSLEEMLDRADQAMYASKNLGRNQVRAWQADG